MPVQNYNSHIRFYPPHHFVFYPLLMLLIGTAAYFSFTDEANRIIWIFITTILAVIVWVAFMMRQHYALTLQNRLVLLELRYRYYSISSERLELIEDRLSEAQLFALRFAPNEELLALTQRAVKENLAPDAIKKAIINWLPDHRRV